MALTMMEKVKCLQQEFVHILRVIAGMQAYKTHVRNGLQHLKNVDSTLQSLKDVSWNKEATKTSTDTLLQQLKSECFFPSMDAQGRITLHHEPTFTFSKRSSTTESTASSGSNGIEAGGMSMTGELPFFAGAGAGAADADNCSLL
eukprot:scaffold5380_cov131-Cylindrotheca_fusiformis.AAC.25